MKILFASRDRDLLRSCGTILMMDGHSVDTVFDGAQLSEELGSGIYDMVIYMSGLPMAEDGSIASACRDLSVPSIELTEGSVSIGMLTDRVPPSAYLCLPFEAGQLEEMMASVCGEMDRRETIDPRGLSVATDSFEVNGERLSLSSFGISTLGFLNSAENEQYAFHIDGDEDDENTSGKKDKLRTAIEEDPDKLMEFMQKLMSNLYENIDQKMKSTELSSAYKVYNDKEMDKEQTRIAEMITKWEEKVSDKEEYYFDKFTQMEVALSKLQNQTSSISGLLGGQ